ncbi:GPR endopeptidase [Clostridium cylindrosporum]|uniref:Germination protease n=1 Tax=Clostridium cylindrosporum DSM 605 TaxID=1121307 RepID=A0A0J8D6B7_CLOCY|nr:GPR endopeptidase [Clostridium cylindrosporum]KMT21635.1 germination protease Gpr [Clostridium cylindrosporum DSM 605]
MFNPRTDLAVEAREIYNKNREVEIEGVSVDTKRMLGGIRIVTVNVLNEKGEKAIKKPKGTYITMEIPEVKHYDVDLHEDLTRALSEEILKIVDVKKDLKTLVIGLGNWHVTPDALGPKVISKLMITRHLKEYMPDELEEGINPVAALAPGVLGITGIETAEIVKGLVEKTKPDVVIVIDALAARKVERVARTIQIGDTGIAPGAGVGNKRMELSKETLGVPVIAIGVPTVVDAATLANDTIDSMIDSLIEETKNNSETKGFYNMLKSLDKEEKYNMIKGVLSPYSSNMLVTPKDIDALIEDLAKIIANSINISLHPSIDLNDIDRYLF